MTYEVLRSEDNFTIDFKFETESASVDIRKVSACSLRVTSPQEYSPLGFWMAQDPDSEEPLRLDAAQQREKVRASLLEMGWGYLPTNDPDVCQMGSVEDVNELTIDRLARFLEPRLALKERFDSD